DAYTVSSALAAALFTNSSCDTKHRRTVAGTIARLVATRADGSDPARAGGSPKAVSMLKYARINTFYRYLRPFQARMRKRRSEICIRNMSLREGLRVIDLGGTPEIWQFIDTPLDITLVNLEYDPKTDVSIAPQHKFTLLEGDACKLDLPSCSFDVAFSNSVIEH